MAIRQAIGTGIVLMLVAALTGCAQQPVQTASGVRQEVKPSGPDFGTDNDANYAAAQMGMKLETDVQSLPGYAGLQIVSYGIELDVVGPPTAAIRAAVARDTQSYQGNVIPVRYRSVRYSDKELEALKDQIFADMDGWQKQGIELTTWGIDISSNTVEVGLYHYTTAYRAALIARYGDRVTVTSYDVRPAAS